MITQEELNTLLHYEPGTGVFTRKVGGRGVRAGSVTGCARPDGYLVIQIKRKSYRAHRLAFLFMEGNLPPAEVDHINGVRDDNRWCNLRHATRAENSRNQAIHCDNASGVKGVRWNKVSAKWEARTSLNGVEKHLGIFADIAEAEAAVRAAREMMHGDFANHG